MALPQPARAGIRNVAPHPAMMPRLTSSCENRQFSAAMTTSAASISSIATVKQMPFIAATTGFVRSGGRRLNGSTSLVGNSGLPSRRSGTIVGMSSPAVKWSPSA